MTKKEIQRQRILTYFIDATAQVIDQEGIDTITVRKIADIAGYNAATLYNYFENLDHLVFLAAMKSIRKYGETLPTYIKTAKNALERKFIVTECFCDYIFNNIDIANAIFFAKLDKPINDYVKEYYEIYPDELMHSDEDISTMFLKSNIYDPATTLLNKCADEGFIHREDILEINEMTMIIYNGMLSKVINKEINDPVNILIKRTIKYIKIVYRAYLINPDQLPL